ncbi:hypothetical protein AAC387_Pa12g1075 [Persea americana]
MSKRTCPFHHYGSDVANPETTTALKIRSNCSSCNSPESPAEQISDSKCIIFHQEFRSARRAFQPDLRSGGGFGIGYIGAAAKERTRSFGHPNIPFI